MLLDALRTAMRYALKVTPVSDKDWSSDASSPSVVEESLTLLSGHLDPTKGMADLANLAEERGSIKCAALGRCRKEELIDEIDELHEKLKKYEAVVSLNEPMYCTFCGGETPCETSDCPNMSEPVSWCTGCGFQLMKVRHGITHVWACVNARCKDFTGIPMYCEYCSHRMKDTSTVCEYCGTDNGARRD